MEENVIANILERLAAVEAQQLNLLIMGTVVKLHEDKDLLDIQVGKVVLEELPYFTQRAGAGKTYWMPSVGESGMLLVPSGDLGNAVFMPGHNTKNNPALEKDKNIAVRQWKRDHEERFDGNANTYERRIGDIKEKFDADANEYEISIGSTKLTLTSNEIKGYIAGVGKVQITASVANVNGVTFSGGPTNLQAIVGGLSSAGVWPVTYVPVLIK